MTSFSEIRYASLAKQVMQRCDELGKISQCSDYLDRRYLTTEHKAANALVGGWLQDAGMTTWQDEAGNLWGRYESKKPDAKRFILGSHLDTVPNGGKYDGMLGVIAPLTLIKAFNQYGIEFPFHLDIVGFGDEEGTRFSSTLLGSRALTGQWEKDWEHVEDDDGISLKQALEEFGLAFDSVLNAAIDKTNLLGYLELHIEQGPVLENQNMPVGIVSGIAGAKRFDFTVQGMAGHAGTVPMPLRQDALCATSEMILMVEKIATQQDIVATVGRIANRPNGVNVISGLTEFSLDIRSASDDKREAALDDILKGFQHIATKRNVTLSSKQTHSASAVHCDGALQSILKEAISESNYSPLTLLSGAGHDAMAIADICPVAMLFMRCEKGISHHPAEAIMESDVEVTLEVLGRALRKIEV
ncbi:allantoate amidohydrolase [Marinomonas mediterranea]|jgi:amidase, hydantoinase/carbamoylase family|uniref:Amidase, hydantoinase/carbamoylase family n=1 Tax=Marinomonas mediterranea (strain ATCC 700492 / JCM 21426 / NBRC 103028 / MMB-1) TaxID=717774 RepID=F2JW71_MARM1|nr:allantoate amidohydrolase [Marinomonas mediterranea]ADZ89459.1 amidase, hydantoinase/carbamoylase family [Marinomonas mediterranea MMB-1]WCN15711.1 allantoate amidohydrolase [Marinomonas mediterranea MMB-1]